MIEILGTCFSFSHRGVWVFALTCQWFDSFAKMVWKMKGVGCPPFFSFPFILHAENVGGVATNAQNLYLKTCYYCK